MGEVLVPPTFAIQAKNAKGEVITDSGALFRDYIALTDKPKANPEPTEEDDEDESSSSSKEEDDPDDAFMAFLDQDADEGEQKPAEEGDEKKDDEKKDEEAKA